MRRWLNWAKKAGYIDRLPSFPRQVSKQKIRPKALERREQNRLLRETERRGKARDLALIRLLLSCGLRVGEAVTLRVDDLNLGERHGRVVVQRGKGNKYRVVPVPVKARKVLRDWLAERNKNFPESVWLFPNKKGGHISTRYAEQVVGELARRAGIECSPHTLRHTCATNMLRLGAGPGDGGPGAGA